MGVFDKPKLDEDMLHRIQEYYRIRRYKVKQAQMFKDLKFSKPSFHRWRNQGNADDLAGEQGTDRVTKTPDPCEVGEGQSNTDRLTLAR